MHVEVNSALPCGAVRQSEPIFEGRFKSVAVLDEEALLAIGVYFDLGIAGV
jgi:hypothetical protein